MSDERGKPGNPVTSGLVALLAVAVSVGLVLALVTFAMVNMVGLTDESSADGDATAKESMSIPNKFRVGDDEPEITLATESGSGPSPSDDSTEEREPADERSRDAKRKSPISLSAAAEAVTAGAELYLTGTYPGGEGQILQVQRFENGAWADFPATFSVTDETFTTYIVPGVTGQSRFRVVDNTTGKASNEVSVLIR